MNLSTQLRRDALLGGGFGNDAGLLDGVGEWLFAVAVQAGADCPNAGRRVMVVRGSHNDGIELARQRLNHFPIVGVKFCLREVLGLPIQVILIDIAQGDDVFAGDALHIFRRAVGRAHAGNVKFFE